MRDHEKPTVRDLGIDVDSVAWHGSGEGADAVQVAFVDEWVLMRTEGGDVLVFDHAEWDAFVRGAKGDEFDDAASPPTGGSDTVS